MNEMIYGSHMHVMTPVSGVDCVVHVAFIKHVT